MPTPDFTGREALDNNNLEDIKSILLQILQDNEKYAMSQEQRDRQSQEQRDRQAPSSGDGFTKTVANQVIKSLPKPFAEAGQVVFDELFNLRKSLGKLSNSSGSTPGLSGSIDAASIKQLQPLLGGGGKGPGGPGGIVAGGIGGAAEGAAVGEEALAAAGPVGLAVGEVAKAAFKIGNAVNGLQQKMAESGAITGQGRTAGVGAAFQAFKMGANPFDLLSAQFADEIITTFRSSGFKDGLAYSLSDSFGSVTKQIGETLSKQILPITVAAAATIETQSGSIKNLKDQSDAIKDSFGELTKTIKGLDAAAKISTGSSADLQANFIDLSSALIQTGTLTTGSKGTIQTLTTLLESLTNQKNAGGDAIAPNPLNPTGISQAIIGGSKYLAGMSGIASPLALVGNSNVTEVSKNFTKLFINLANSMPSELKSGGFGGYQQYAAYLLAGFLPSVGMGGLTVDQVAALLQSNAGGKTADQKLLRAAAGNANLTFNKDFGLASSVGATLGDKGVFTWDKLNNQELLKQGGTLDVIKNNPEKFFGSSSWAALSKAGITGDEISGFLSNAPEGLSSTAFKEWLRAMIVKKAIDTSNFKDVPNKENDIKALDVIGQLAQQGKTQNFFDAAEANTPGVSSPTQIVINNIINGHDLGNLIKDMQSTIIKT